MENQINPSSTPKAPFGLKLPRIKHRIILLSPHTILPRELVGKPPVGHLVSRRNQTNRNKFGKIQGSSVATQDDSIFLLERAPIAWASRSLHTETSEKSQNSAASRKFSKSTKSERKLKVIAFAWQGSTYSFTNPANSLLHRQRPSPPSADLHQSSLRQIVNMCPKQRHLSWIAQDYPP